MQPSEDADAIQQLASSAFDLDTVALVASAAWPQGQPDAAPVSPGEGAPSPTIRLTQLTPGRLGVEVASERGGMLVFAENWLPGWAVEDIQCPPETPTCEAGTWPAGGLPYFKPVRANLALVGAPIPPGTVQFSLVYRPASIPLGLLLSAVTLLLLAVAGLFSLRKWRNNPRPSQP
ncbi:MAG: hypothetical protein IPK16_09420 [Anaerolineales bacterium]|nr:hypothetical protein [Anaerolineales bacterium]